MSSDLTDYHERLDRVKAKLRIEAPTLMAQFDLLEKLVAFHRRHSGADLHDLRGKPMTAFPIVLDSMPGPVTVRELYEELRQRRFYDSSVQIVTCNNSVNALARSGVIVLLDTEGGYERRVDLPSRDQK